MSSNIPDLSNITLSEPSFTLTQYHGSVFAFTDEQPNSNQCATYNIYGQNYTFVIGTDGDIYALVSGDTVSLEFVESTV